MFAARSMSRTKKVSWITRMAMQNRLCYSNGKWDAFYMDKYIEFMEKLVDTMDRVFGQEWDMHAQSFMAEGPDNYEREDVYELFPVIRFKRVLLKNSKGLEKPLNDMFMSFRVEKSPEGHFYLRYPTGTRATFPVEDMNTGFVHSHLRYRSINRFSDAFMLQGFCTGSGEINDFLAQMRGEDVDSGFLEFFFVFLDTFISWESLEGTPHAYMSKTLSEYDRQQVNPGEAMCRECYMGLREKLAENPELFSSPDFVFHDGRYIIKDNPKLDMLLRRVSMSSAFIKKKVLCKLSPDGKYYSMKKGSASRQDLGEYNRSMENSFGERPYFLLQGEKVHYTIVQSRQEKDDPEEFNVHPKFKEYVKQRMEEKLYSRAIRYSELAAQRQGNDAGSSVVEDQVPVQEHS